MEAMAMGLPVTQAETRYDTPTLEKAIRLAGQLQSQHHDSLTAREIEAIGVEVGLEPVFIQQALTQLAAPSSAQPLPVSSQKATSLQNSNKISAVQVATFSTLMALLPALYLVLAVAADAERRGAAAGSDCLLMSLACGGLGYLSGRRRAGLYAGSALFLVFLLRIAAHSHAVRHGAWLHYTLLYFPVMSSMGAAGGWLREHFAPLKRETAPQNIATTLSRADMLQTFYALQQQLQDQKQHRAFLSVDVAQSSQLKSGAGELAVEYSFGQLRTWVEAIVHAHKGSLQAAAGDGMMCMFPQNADALRAARQIQQQIGQFNQLHNRLPGLVQVRCGVSAGSVAIETQTPIGHLQSVVIDRAAWLQKQGQPGAIMVSAELAADALVELGSLHPVADDAGGETVFAWQPGYTPITELATGITLKSSR